MQDQLSWFGAIRVDFLENVKYKQSKITVGGKK